MNHLPYSEILFDLLKSIHSALYYCFTEYKKGNTIVESDVNLLNTFSKFEKKYRQSGLNKHLIKGLTKTEQKRYKIYPRLSKITIQTFYSTQSNKKYSVKRSIVLPSPLNIIYHALTIPSEPQTAAYPFLLCRSLLFHFFKVLPQQNRIEGLDDVFDLFKEEDVLNSINSFKNYNKIQARWPDPRLKPNTISSKVNYLTGNLLAVKGITHLWFKNENDLINFCNSPKKATNIDKIGLLYSIPKYLFRLSGRMNELPDSSQVINWIFGIPLPIRGADILFSGGLKTTKSSGLVLSLRGKPGTGKTSAALSIAALMSPFNTNTIYLSLEEDPEDLETRLISLIPDYLKELSIYNKRINHSKNMGWFYPYKIRPNISIDEISKILKFLSEDLIIQNGENLENKTSIKIPAVAPLVIVIDNLNELFAGVRFSKESYEQLELFIEQCRKMKAIVILIGAEELQNKLEYLVDVSINLKHVDLDKKNEKPTRILRLVKTRHQLSRQGAHIFHISKSSGFRISPQVPSQLDKREKIKRQLPSRNDFLHTLNILNTDNGFQYQKHLDIAVGSQILIHGHGSSGKAGFALKLILSPYINKRLDILKTNNTIVVNNAISRNKVLIVSFLYPPEYYEILLNKIKSQNLSLYRNYINPIVKVQAFYPGYLTPEDFINKLVRLLDEAELEGEPYTGILLDGLHNVFLQFKNLQEYDMSWPLLYDILARYNLTTVSTFTNFTLNESVINKNINGKINISQIPDDHMLMQQGQKPFLHGLVQATDYYFTLEEVSDEIQEIGKRYFLSVKSSIRVTPPKNMLVWDRKDLVFTEII